MLVVPMAWRGFLMAIGTISSGAFESRDFLSENVKLIDISYMLMVYMQIYNVKTRSHPTTIVEGRSTN